MGKLAEEARRYEKDTGSPEAQIAYLTDRIAHATAHLQRHRKDFSTQRSLMKMVGKRSRFLRYLKRENEQRYVATVNKLGLRK